MLRSRLIVPTLILLMMHEVAVCGQTEINVRFFEQHIRPVLASHCVKCHGHTKQEGNLRLDSLNAMLRGGDSGPAVTAGKPEESLLVEALRYEGLEMPPAGPLDEEQVQHFVSWIAAKTPWPEHSEPLRESSGSFSRARQTVVGNSASRAARSVRRSKMITGPVEPSIVSCSASWMSAAMRPVAAGG